ncbi:GNAT family N-acetyltransferase [Shewanella litorisediminis]|uniref:GNAT family N-acetyltransferase n=1 Tax=Shewanella litorisediminis TaxID=1173586 RepID=A0ABX7G872_9GAMM|nr:GNAT family N-acetyltransferase [Shewanella litorisediminis]MCL2917765.1 GNAT family N-acetyltransferase [Shewanella litorisediminis]QRH03546.1 GNAT family N-acetyltransferase [Shewanella litorisediminis]
MIRWQTQAFADLDTLTLYRLLKLRVDIFVVEQHCPYPELDEKDLHPQAMHLLGWQQEKLVAYARILPPGLSYPQASIGRVAVEESERGAGVARALMNQAISLALEAWPDAGIQIGAQEYLQAFYTSLGFTPVSAVYLEDGIPHLDMRFHQRT